jgi:hypothetical protein
VNSPGTMFPTLNGDRPTRAKALGTGHFCCAILVMSGKGDNKAGDRTVQTAPSTKTQQNRGSLQARSRIRRAGCQHHESRIRGSDQDSFVRARLCAPFGAAPNSPASELNQDFYHAYSRRSSNGPSCTTATAPERVTTPHGTPAQSRIQRALVQLGRDGGPGQWHGCECAPPGPTRRRTGSGGLADMA